MYINTLSVPHYYLPSATDATQRLALRVDPKRSFRLVCCRNTGARAEALASLLLALLENVLDDVRVDVRAKVVLELLP